MKVKTMIEKIIEDGDSEKMYKLNDMLNELICDLKVHNPKMYHDYKTCIYELAYGKIILPEKAEEIVNNMLPYGEHYDMEMVKQIMRDNNFKYEISDFYLVLNSIYNDYFNVFGEESDETYIKMSKSWLDDKDAIEDKVYIYFTNIVKQS